jgi:chloramphenicol-sensitive protein RarD
MNQAHLAANVGAWDLFGHRLLFSFITLFFIAFFRKKLGALKEIWLNPKTRIMLIVSGILISTNWLVYIYAVNTGRVLEASMGYFLNPLINVAMGRLILKETMRPAQWPAVILALVAILILTMNDLDHFPWLALLLSLTFAMYGLIRKLAQVGSLDGLTFETFLMIIPTLVCWYFRPTSPATVMGLVPHWKLFLLSLSGVVTCLPLILFAYSTKRLTLQTLGFIQYLSPSLKFVCGWAILNEPLAPERLKAFMLIWVALGWYTMESVMTHRKTKAKNVVTTE